MYRLLLLFISVLLSAACAVRPPVADNSPVTGITPPPNEFYLFYDSDPPGASLYEKGKKIGETPFWAIYGISQPEHAKGLVAIDPVTVVWPSGVSTDSFPGLLFALSPKYEGKHTFIRPDKAAGKDEDYEYGLKRLMYRYEHGEKPPVR